MPPTKSHQQCLELVCAVCTNLNGYKAKKVVSDIEVELIKKYVFPGYEKHSIWFPQGLCVRCALDLREYDHKEEEQEKENGGGGDGISSGTKMYRRKHRNVKLVLPDDYICNLPIQTRGQVLKICTCRWCYLARLNGPDFQKWRASLNKSIRPIITHICSDCGRGVPVTVKVHKCSTTDQDRVRSLVQSLPSQVKGKLTLALLKEQQDINSNSEATIALPQLNGGHKVQVTVGKVAMKQPVPLNVKEVQVMSSKAHLTGAQQQSILADLRSKWGRQVVEPGMQKALPEHNRMFSEYFSVEKMQC